ncbi:hypothetical protein F2P56_003595 [Juglans regia]|uniref:Uncharacterized protein LOC108999291 isoform X1 n=2 Tax=Juglans regia TaxID=51240 RepID=A0A2I4FJ85_JUGRE|nr:uncharacterized protein LOC108999291 isoform X1 [Juglans regia]KAF5476905.1 hypothetical protein F2P56_003595 [Juglans regia]
MAHHISQRRNLANPEPKPSMDPTLKKQYPKPTTPNPTSHLQIRANPDPPVLSNSKSSSFMPHNFSRLNPYHKVRASRKPANTQPPPTLVDVPLQAKAMTTSAMWDSSKFLLTRPNHQSRTIAPRLAGEGEAKSTKEVSEEKSKKSSKELDKKKIHKVKVIEKRREPREGLDVKPLPEKVKDIEPKDLLDGHDINRLSVSLTLRGGRRRSFCGSQVELADIFAGSGVKVVAVDMPPFMQIHVTDCARKAYDSMEKFTSKTLACTIKKEFDGVYGPAWHCIVGKSFGSFVTHSVGGFMYFSMDQKLYILLFKTTVQRAD